MKDNEHQTDSLFAESKYNERVSILLTLLLFQLSPLPLLQYIPGTLRGIVAVGGRSNCLYFASITEQEKIFGFQMVFERIIALS